MNTNSQSHLPIDTYKGARSLFNVQHIYLRIGDQLPAISASLDLSSLDPTASLGEDNTLRLALITAFQYAETLSDPQAVEATLQRLDWKYALYLPTRHPGFTSADLCSFRLALVSSSSSLEEYAHLLNWLNDLGLFGRGQRSLLEPREVLFAVCQFTRYQRLYNAMKAALSCLVALDPDWMRRCALSHWYDRYAGGKMIQPVQLSPSVIIAESELLGADIEHLLKVIEAENLPEIRQQDEFIYLARLWKEQCQREGDQLILRSPARPYCSLSHLGQPDPE